MIFVFNYMPPDSQNKKIGRIISVRMVLHDTTLWGARFFIFLFDPAKAEMEKRIAGRIYWAIRIASCKALPDGNICP